MADEARFYRSGDGSTVHRAGCSSLNVAHSRAARWDYAADLTFVQVMEKIRSLPWLKACKRCMKAQTKV